MRSVREDDPLVRALRRSGIVTALALVFCMALDRTFVRDPAGARLLASNDRAFITMENAEAILDDMIDRDEVTWDPTNGALIERVLTHLKRSPRRKILLIGSSQFLVVRDDRSYAGVSKRVDRALEALLGGAFDVYNLSLGGMTMEEKKRLLRTATGLEEFDSIVVEMTLWDSVSSEVRVGIRQMAADLATGRRVSAGRALSLQPGRINQFATTMFRTALNCFVPFFEHRGRIRGWLEERLAETLPLGGTRGAIEPADELKVTPPGGVIPVQYAYDIETQKVVMDHVRSFLGFLGTLGGRSGPRILIVLTPYRQDPGRPAYSPPGFYERFVGAIGASCAESGCELVDASSILDRSHFGIYQDGSDKGKIDVLHFDAAGHRLLAE